MSKSEPVTQDKLYYTVMDGTFRTQVPSDHPDAIVREWSTKDGKSGTKYEKHHRALFGTIESVSIQDGEYGKNLNITLDMDEDMGKNPVITVQADSRYGESLLKVLPNLKPETEYRFFPYSIEEGDKKKQGISVATKDDEGKYTQKVQNYFWDDEAKESTNGYPIPDEDDKADWAFFYKKANKFLVKYTEENVIGRFTGQQVAATKQEYPEEEINPENIPF